MIKEKEKILKAPLGEEEKEKKKRMREEEKRKKKEDAEEEEGIICDEKSVSLLAYRIQRCGSRFGLYTDFSWACAVLRIRDVYSGSEFFHPVSRAKKIPDPHQRINYF
jgi:hypothetical protein